MQWCSTLKIKEFSLLLLLRPSLPISLSASFTQKLPVKKSKIGNDTQQQACGGCGQHPGTVGTGVTKGKKATQSLEEVSSEECGVPFLVISNVGGVPSVKTGQHLYINVGGPFQISHGFELRPV